MVVFTVMELSFREFGKMTNWKHKIMTENNQLYSMSPVYGL